MKRIRRIYVTQNECSWSLTPEAWRRAVEAAVANKEFNWDELGYRMSRPISKWAKQHKPLDWDAQDWNDQLEALKEQL
jgi:hypothetical protein